MNVSFIAEISSNHNQDLDRCLEFIDTAAEIGCSAIKFQLFQVDELFAPEILYQSKIHRQRRNWELPVEFLPELAARCRKVNISLGCTPFFLKAVKILEPYVDFFKISSYELLWKDLLKACAQTGKPVILSTGMATLDEVQEAVGCLRRASCNNLTLLHCLSEYPVLPENCNLAAIATLRHLLDCPVGWSDHSVSPAVLYRAVHRWGASTIEFHLDLEGKGKEYAMGHCWLPTQIKSVIKNIEIGFQTDGSGEKEPAACEFNERDWRAEPSDGLRPLKPMRKKFTPSPFES